MKKPLSALQRKILNIARTQEIVGYPDVLTQVYGFAPSGRGALKFTNHSHLRKRIHSASAAINKAFNRLSERGLVLRVIGGVRHG